MYNGVDLGYLQYKWGEYFLILDVNMDSVLDSKDMEVETSNFASMNNLTDREVRGNHT